MILADENIHYFIIKALREAGFTVNSINEHSKGIKDEEVIKRAIQNNYWLLTEDKDFGEWGVFSSCEESKCYLSSIPVL